MSKRKLTNEDIQDITDFLARCTDDPLLFVLAAFPWGEKGTVLENEEGPLPWQVEVLRYIRDSMKRDKTAPIRVAVASGHGIGKSALVAWLNLWGFMTFPGARGVVTANTETQLRTKTWAEVGKWFHLCVVHDMFSYTDTAMFDRDEEYRKNWRVDCVPWSKENPEAFAGLHNFRNRTLIIFDEASAIDEVIWETAQGAMSDKDTQRIWCVFGNPTRRDGAFYECFHSDRALWHTKQIDSRSVSISDKEENERLRQKWGEDSDQFKVRVRGEFPSSNEFQFIESDLIDEARKRSYKPDAFRWAPVVIGVDPAWNGGDETAIYLRQGLSCKKLRVFSKNESDVVVAQVVAELEDRYHADAVNVDFGYGTGIVSAAEAWGRHWSLVRFSGKSGREDCINKRVEMWANLRDWLRNGGSVDPEDKELADDLAAPERLPTDDGKLKLESKEDMRKRGVHSPNCADALALTFAFPVVRKKDEAAESSEYDVLRGHDDGYDPFEDM